MITASGDAFEDASAVADPADRRARDVQLRAVFTDPTSRHHESIAEAELDIDYSGSPIVMGDSHNALAPGQRLPDTIDIHAPSGQPRLLHELTHRASHTALILGHTSADGDSLSKLADSLRASTCISCIEETVVLTTRSGEPNPHTRLAPSAAEQLGISDTTLLVIRPDGHVGLRADRNHREALAAYHALLTTGRN
jgi:hypothetical protein